MSIYRTIEVNADLINGVVNTDANFIDNIIETNSNLINETVVNNISDYELLNNKPLINSITLIGDKSFEELGLQGITNTELENMLR